MNHEILLTCLPQEAINFFATFSRFEYALKRARFLKSGQPGGNAWADWDGFADALDRASGNGFLDRVPTSELQRNPPKTQVVGKDGTLDWGEAPKIKSTRDLFSAVRRVRNNLFHGGKYRGGPMPDPERDEKLLRAAIEILDLALTACPRVSGEFWAGHSCGRSGKPDAVGCTRLQERA